MGPGGGDIIPPAGNHPALSLSLSSVIGLFLLSAFVSPLPPSLPSVTCPIISLNPQMSDRDESAE